MALDVSENIQVKHIRYNTICIATLNKSCTHENNGAYIHKYVACIMCLRYTPGSMHKSKLFRQYNKKTA